MRRSVCGFHSFSNHMESRSLDLLQDKIFWTDSVTDEYLHYMDLQTRREHVIDNPGGSREQPVAVVTVYAAKQPTTGEWRFSHPYHISISQLFTQASYLRNKIALRMSHTRSGHTSQGTQFDSGIRTNLKLTHYDMATYICPPTV